MGKRIKPYLGIIVGSLIFALGLNYFIVANRLAEGGLVGITLILFYLFHLPIGLLYLIFNIPLFILGWRLLGRDFAIKTLVGVAAASLFVDLTQGVGAPAPEPLLAALYGGGVCGLGLGIIFRFGGSTGGADIIARLINKYFGTSLGKVLFVIDIVVISLVGIIFGQATAMYSLVALFVVAQVIDFVQEGAYAAKAAMIISDNPQEIMERILGQLGRGATILRGMGGYTKTDKKIVYCVVSRHEVIRIKNLVREIDPHAFIVVNDVHEVLGEGFRDLG